LTGEIAMAVAADLLRTLRGLHLLEPARLAELSGDVSLQNLDAGELTQELIRRNLLTSYQAEQVAAGQGQNLVLGPYLILDRIGQGGAGAVFKARHRKQDRLVALKVLRQDRLGSSQVNRRFQREARLVTRLSHPNIVTIFDAGGDQGRNYLAMEYVQGQNLAQLVQECGPLPIPEACDIVRQVALGLQHAHDNNLVHRDIKPANLLIASTEKGLVKIIDLGLARILESCVQERADSTLTEPGIILGTADYMSPEQGDDPRAADIRSDLYSLGCTFFYLLTGQPPFPGGALLQKLDRHRREQPPSLPQLRPEVSPQVARILARLLAKRPEDRLQTPAALATALAEIAADHAHLVEGWCRRFEGHAKQVWAVAFTPIGQMFLSAGFDHTVRLWDWASGDELCLCQGHTAPVLSVACSPDGNHALSSGQDGTVRLWELPSGRELSRLQGHTDEVECVAFSPDGRFAALGGGYSHVDGNWPPLDCSVRLWDAVNWRELRRLDGHVEPAWTLAFSPDSRFIVSGSGDQSVRLWNVATGQEVHRFQGHANKVTSVAYSPNGLAALSGSLDGTLRLWHLHDGRELRQFTGHEAKVRSVAFSPCGRFVLSGGNDRTVRLWQVETSRELACFQGHLDNVTSVAFSPQGDFVLSGSSDRTICLWRLPDNLLS
jgi:tRNA A-37 threonylcarbamoyl transferase component Bud32